MSHNDVDEQKWYSFGLREYFIYNGSDLRSQQEARGECNEMDSHLVIDDADDIHRFLVDLIYRVIIPHTLRPPYRSFFIGLKDFSGGNSNFQWENGDLLHFLPGTPMQWARGEPNNFNNIPEDCVTMGSTGLQEEYKWFDVPCEVKRSYICERVTPTSEGINQKTMFLTTMAIFAILLLLFMTIFQERTRMFRKRRRMKRTESSRLSRQSKVLRWFTGEDYEWGRVILNGSETEEHITPQREV
ncbi:C-type lectin lectoxin-Lio2-like [Styela clava]